MNKSNTTTTSTTSATPTPAPTRGDSAAASRFIPPPVPYSVYKRLLGRYNALYSQWQALLEENHELRMKLAARPTKLSPTNS